MVADVYRVATKSMAHVCQSGREDTASPLNYREWPCCNYCVVLAEMRIGQGLFSKFSKLWNRCPSTWGDLTSVVKRCVPCVTMSCWSILGLTLVPLGNQNCLTSLVEMIKEWCPRYIHQYVSLFWMVAGMRNWSCWSLWCSGKIG